MAKQVVVKHLAAEWLTWPDLSWVASENIDKLWPKDRPKNQIPFVLRFEVVETGIMGGNTQVILDQLKVPDFAVSVKLRPPKSAKKVKSQCEVLQADWSKSKSRYTLLALSDDLLDPGSSDWEASIVASWKNLSSAAASDSIPV